MVQIDGARGEGGGQMLRSALTLAVLTSQAMRMSNIRARRPTPGLRSQHVKAVEAAAAVGLARVEGACLGSQSLSFEPAGIRAGDFHFDIGTAGATALVLQTILLPLGLAPAPSAVTLHGGTHVPWAPCFHYLDLHWLPYMRRLGLAAELTLDLAGFYPQGGSQTRATIRPIGALLPLRLTERGDLKRIRGLSAVANVDVEVAERQRSRALRRLADTRREVAIEVVELPSRFTGTMLLLIAEFANSQCCYFGLGAPGKRAERVADEAAGALLEFLATDGAVDQYLADQLVVPLALADGVSELRTSKVTRHLLTNSEIVKLFLPVEIEIRGKVDQPGLIRVTGASVRRAEGTRPRAAGAMVDRFPPEH
jgi:RNA 3'-terminal phosphate cyclase (ATP)